MLTLFDVIVIDDDEADDEFEYIYEDNRPDIYQESKVGSNLDHHQQKESHIENNDEDNEPDNYNNNYDDKLQILVVVVVDVMLFFVTRKTVIMIETDGGKKFQNFFFVHVSKAYFKFKSSRKIFFSFNVSWL